MLKLIHQIEMTSRCNLRCKYCVHPNMQRPKIDMDKGTFKKAIKLALMLKTEHGGMRELNLAGIGESTMHPDFCELVQYARNMIGWDVDIILATNGVSLTREHAETLGKVRARVWVSLHRPEKAALAVNLLREHEVLAGVSIDPSVSAVDWAGQVSWKVTAQGGPCTWLRDSLGFVMADGRISTCCFDSTGEGVIGSVDAYATTPKPYSLCRKCHLTY